MRNPKESWDRSDSMYLDNGKFVLGEKDLALAQKLIAGGTEHRKFLRQIVVSVDITAPLYLWKEFDTYKIGTTANSTSTMHTLATTKISKRHFEMSDLATALPIEFNYPNLKSNNGRKVDVLSSIEQEWEHLICLLEFLRTEYLRTGDKKYWKELIRFLPSSWQQKRTVTLNYENLRSIYHQRANHKLIEWQNLRNWIETLPYALNLICSHK